MNIFSWKVIANENLFFLPQKLAIKRVIWLNVVTIVYLNLILKLQKYQNV